MPTPDAILSITDVTHAFGGVKAIDDCTWSLERGRLAALIGPNGAGKSTLIDIVMGALKPQHGRVQFENAVVSGWAPHRLANRGLIRTFQVARVFDELTVLENMLLASQHQTDESLFNVLFRARRGRRAEKQEVSTALDLLADFDLVQMRNEYAKALSGGQKRLLELARALMAKPKVLMLDEPMAAINPVLVKRIGEHLQYMRSLGVTLLLVEHNLNVVEQLCDWVSVMVQGRILANGTMAEMRAHPEVISAYLGREAV
jgi:neutral amino acid transport system ATP-binding protein